MAELTVELLPKEFEVSSEDLAQIFRHEIIKGKKFHAKIDELGGMQGILHALKTHPNHGISNQATELSLRRSIFGANLQEKYNNRGFFLILLDNSKDALVLALILLTVICMIIGIINQEDAWIDEVTILSAIFIGILIQSLNEYIKEKLLEKSQKQKIKALVIRDGVMKKLDAEQLHVGDIVRLQAGDLVPADGLLICGNNITVNQRTISGNWATVVKSSYNMGTHDADPTLLCGSFVQQGTADIVVCAVGQQVTNSINQIPLQEDATPLSIKLGRIAKDIGLVGCVFAVLLVMSLVVHLLIRNFALEDAWQPDSWSFIIDSVIIGVTIVIFTVPEGMPQSICMYISYSMSRMRKQGIELAQLRAWEEMGRADVVLLSKTGLLTHNEQKVTKVYTSSEVYTSGAFHVMPEGCRKLVRHIGSQLCRLWLTSDGACNGNATDWACARLAAQLGYTNAGENLVQQIPFDKNKMYMSSTISLCEDMNRLLVRGAPEVVLNMCSGILEHGQIFEITDTQRYLLNNVVSEFAYEGLRPIVLAYKDIPRDIDNRTCVEEDLIFFALIGIEDPMVADATAQISMLQDANLDVKLVTGENLEIAEKVAQDCGILDSDGTVLTGEMFRERLEIHEDCDEDGTQHLIVENLKYFQEITTSLKVLARATPRDKLILTTGLRQLGLSVAVTCNSPQDAATLNTADVGIAFGAAVNSNSADIQLLKPSIHSIVTAIQWGRYAHTSARLFMQFQITGIFVLLFTQFIGALIIGAAPLGTVQILWINVIMGTLALSALAMEPPNSQTMQKKSHQRNEQVVTGFIWRNILSMALYQIIALFIILFAADQILGLESEWHHDQWSDEQGDFTLFFNVFVFLQLFSMINCRKLTSEEWNIFKGIHHNIPFLVILPFTIIVQISVVEFGGYAMKCAPLSWEMHLLSVAIGVGGLIWGLLTRIIPSRIFSSCFITYKQQLKAHNRPLGSRKSYKSK